MLSDGDNEVKGVDVSKEYMGEARHSYTSLHPAWISQVDIAKANSQSDV